MDLSMIFKTWEIVSSVIHAAPTIKRLIDLGLPVMSELQKTHPQIVPILQAAGTALFPEQKTTVDMVAAAAQAMFDPHGNAWIQRGINKLLPATLIVDGNYGPLTKAAVKQFQAAHPPLVVDGFAGDATCGVIATELAKVG